MQGDSVDGKQTQLIGEPLADFASMADDLAVLDDRGVHQRLHQALVAERRAAALRIAALAELVKRRYHISEGCGRPDAYFQYATRCSQTIASQTADIIDKRDDLPHTLDALAAGKFSFEHAAVSASIVTEETRANAGPSEAGRVLELRGRNIAQARAYARRLRDHLTPAATKPSLHEQRRRDRGIRFVNHQDGTESAIVTFDPENRERFHRLLTPTEHELARLDRQNRDADEAGAPEAFERRTASQRRFDGFMALLSAGANATASQPVVEMVATLTESTHGKMHAQLTDGTELLESTVARLCCSARFLRIVLDADGREVNLGTTSRIPTRAQRRALEVRDQGCRFPSCTRPLWMTHAHHIVFVENGGETSLDNLVLLCEHHHHLVHEGGFGLVRQRDGTLHFTRPDGTKLATAPYRVEPVALRLTG